MLSEINQFKFGFEVADKLKGLHFTVIFVIFHGQKDEIPLFGSFVGSKYI